MNKGIIIVGGGARGMYFTELLEQKLYRKVAAIVENYEEGYEYIKSNLRRINRPQIPIFKTIEEMKEKIPLESADILFIMTPEWNHSEVFEKAVKGGYHIFLEKPVSDKREGVEKILRLEKSTNRIIQLGFVLRYSVFYKKIKEIIEQGTLGKLVLISMNERLTLQHGAKFKRSWNSMQQYTGGFINEKCCHDIDLMCWLKEHEAEPIEVFSYGSRHFSGQRDTPVYCSECTIENCPWRDSSELYGKQTNGKIYLDNTSIGLGRCIFHSLSDINDHQSINLIFNDGTQALFSTVSMSGNPGRDISIHGTDGYLEGRLETGYIRYRNYWKDEDVTVELSRLNEHGGGDEHIISGFLGCIDNGTKSESNLQAGARASFIAFAADNSVKTGCKTNLNEFLKREG